MDFYEQAVLSYLTRNQDTFVIPQFSIAGKAGGEWSSPDFVAIKPAEKKCFVVEVSAAYNLNSLAEKLLKKESQWIDKLKNQLIDKKIIDGNWVFEVKVFVRSDRTQWLKNKCEELLGVEIKDIERTFTPWNYSD